MWHSSAAAIASTDFHNPEAGLCVDRFGTAHATRQMFVPILDKVAQTAASVFHNVSTAFQQTWSEGLGVVELAADIAPESSEASRAAALEPGIVGQLSAAAPVAIEPQQPGAAGGVQPPPDPEEFQALKEVAAVGLEAPLLVEEEEGHY